MSTKPLSIQRGVTVGIVGTDRRCVITQVLSGNRVGVRDVDGQGPPEEVGVEMLSHPPPEKQFAAPDEETAPARLNQGKDLAVIDKEAWAKAERRLEAIKPFLHAYRPPAKLLEARAKEYKCDLTTIYRWLRFYRNSGWRLTSLLDNPPSVPKGTKKLDKIVEQILSEMIRKYYLTPQRYKVSKIEEKLKAEFIACGISLDLLPHRNTIRRRVFQLSGRERELARFGQNKTTKYDAIGTGFQASFPLEYVQIDHTKLNVTLLDSKGRNIGRPYLTVAIDVYSRMIVGYYVAFETPGALATGLCISQAILSKERWLQERSDYFSQIPEWPCYGPPVHLHADNAREFRGDMLKRACAQYQINAIFRPVRKPQYGAHIESLMDKVSIKMSELPGTTFSNPIERGKHYDSEAKATMTLDDLLRWLANYFLCFYHYQVHSGLGKTPLEKWHQGFVEGSESAPALGRLPDRYIGDSAERLTLDFLPFEERTITEAGVRMFYIDYCSPVLRRWFRAKDPEDQKKSLKFIFRYDPRDMSYVYFWNPEDERYEKIPYRNLANPPVTLWEIRKAEDFLVQQGAPKSSHNEAMKFAAIITMRDLEEESIARKGKSKAAGKFKGGVHRDRLKGQKPPKKSLSSDDPSEPEKDDGSRRTYDDLDMG